MHSLHTLHSIANTSKQSADPIVLSIAVLKALYTNWWTILDFPTPESYTPHKQMYIKNFLIANNNWHNMCNAIKHQRQPQTDRLCLPLFVMEQGKAFVWFTFCESNIHLGHFNYSSYIEHLAFVPVTRPTMSKHWRSTPSAFWLLTTAFHNRCLFNWLIIISPPLSLGVKLGVEDSSTPNFTPNDNGAEWFKYHCSCCAQSWQKHAIGG